MHMVRIQPRNKYIYTKISSFTSVEGGKKDFLHLLQTSFFLLVNVKFASAISCL